MHLFSKKHLCANFILRKNKIKFNKKNIEPVLGWKPEFRKIDFHATGQSSILPVLSRIIFPE